MSGLWGHGGRYEEWATFLDRWAAGEQRDPAGLPTLREEDFTGDSWERLTDRLTGALSGRLRLWSRAVAHSIAEARDEFAVGRALSHARTGLRSIRAVAGHPGLPPELANRLVDLVDDAIRSAQQELERHTEALGRGGAGRDAAELRLRTIRDNPLTASTAAGPVDTPAGAGWYADLSTQRRRRVITDTPYGRA